jgi:hypothetical protein
MDQINFDIEQEALQARDRERYRDRDQLAHPQDSDYRFRKCSLTHQVSDLTNLHRRLTVSRSDAPCTYVHSRGRASSHLTRTDPRRPTSRQCRCLESSARVRSPRASRHVPSGGP